MVTIKLTEHVPYSCTTHHAEQDISLESIHIGGATKGEVLASVVDRLKEILNLQVEATMKREGIFLDVDGIRIQPKSPAPAQAAPQSR